MSKELIERGRNKADHWINDLLPVRNGDAALHSAALECRALCDALEQQQARIEELERDWRIQNDHIVKSNERIDELEAELANRDRDWVLAMGHALGLDSGFDIPIVPEVDPFKTLFEAIRQQRNAKLERENDSLMRNRGDVWSVLANGNGLIEDTYQNRVTAALESLTTLEQDDAKPERRSTLPPRNWDHE